LSDISVEDQQIRVGAAPSARSIRRLSALGIIAALGMLTLGAVMLLDARKDAWRQAENSATNLATALERDIAHHIASYDLSLRGVAEALQQPGIDQVSPEIRHAAVFDRAATADYLGSLLVLDAAGNVVEDSTAQVPHSINFADRDYFRVHQDQPDAGLYVSRPFRSRLRNGDASIAISRRLSAPDGSFAGVVVGTMRLAYFQSRFANLDMGANGAVTLLRADGRLIARNPFRDADIDRDVGNTGALDGLQRVYTYRRVGDLPLILNVAMSVDDIYAAWWSRALVIGPVLVLLCAATMALCVLFRREMLRRIVAEHALTEAADKLLLMASTDSLTGLANRRTFDADLQREWRLAIRTQTPIALLMLDADNFKLFNDRYGHPDGDSVLQRIASCIRSQLRRPADRGVRYGGEEFVALLPDTELRGAVTIAESIRAAIAALAIAHEDAPGGRVTVSIGVASCYPVAGTAPGSLVQAADAALYEAKHAGRNHVRIAGNLPAEAVWTLAPADAAHVVA
jgi:diguanylate cyclase (GGDEF)-like protein